MQQLIIKIYLFLIVLALEQSSAVYPHYIWPDIQLSKRQLNKDRLIEVQLVDKDGQTEKEKMSYRLVFIQLTIQQLNI